MGERVSKVKKDLSKLKPKSVTAQPDNILVNKKKLENDEPKESLGEDFDSKFIVGSYNPNKQYPFSPLT